MKNYKYYKFRILGRYLDVLIYATYKGMKDTRSLTLKKDLMTIQALLEKAKEDGKPKEWDFPVRKTRLKHEKPDVIKPNQMTGGSWFTEYRARKD